MVQMLIPRFVKIFSVSKFFGGGDCRFRQGKNTGNKNWKRKQMSWDRNWAGKNV